MRAFRPSRLALTDEDHEELTEQEKLEKMQLYRRRAEAGLPLFDPPQALSFGIGRSAAAAE